jgi:hypothetical protein
MNWLGNPLFTPGNAVPYGRGGGRSTFRLTARPSAWRNLPTRLVTS